MYYWNYIIFNLIDTLKLLVFKSVEKINFLPNWYSRVELIWQEGLLIDFLQKKIIDNWIKKFLIYSSYLFNERFLFDKIIKFYLNNFIWPLHHLQIFEFNNISNTLTVIFMLLFFFFFIIFLVYFLYFFLMF